MSGQDAPHAESVAPRIAFDDEFVQVGAHLHGIRCRQVTGGRSQSCSCWTHAPDCPGCAELKNLEDGAL